MWRWICSGAANKRRVADYSWAPWAPNDTATLYRLCIALTEQYRVGLSTMYTGPTYDVKRVGFETRARYATGGQVDLSGPITEAKRPFVSSNLCHPL